MAKELVSDELWAVIQPLLPPPKPKPKGGRLPIPDRQVLTGVRFVLMTGIPWEMLPQEMGCGSGMTCWRRLHHWQQAGVWKQLHQVLLNRLGVAGHIEWSRAPLDSATVPAPGGANTPARTGGRSKRHPPGRHRLGGQHAFGAIEPIKRPRGRPRKRPEKLHADKAYDSAEERRSLRKRRIKPRIARRGIESSEKLGRYRWVVERTHSWLNRFRRLKIRYERRGDIHPAFLHIGCALICWKFIQA